MFFEVLSLTYHSPITIDSLTYGRHPRPMAETPVRWVLRRSVPRIELLRNDVNQSVPVNHGV